MRRRLFTYLLLIAGAAAAFWYFRGSEERGPELSQTEFVAQANQVCEDQGEKNRALEPPIRPYTLESESFFKEIHDNLEAARKRFDELNPPAANEATLDRLVALYATVGAKFNTVEAAAAVDQDPEVRASLDEIEVQAEEIATVERELGICAGEASFEESVIKPARVSREDPNAGEGGGFDF